MNEYLATVEGQDYEFDVKATDEMDAHATAVEYLQLAGMEEWVDLLSITQKG